MLKKILITIALLLLLSPLLVYGGWKGVEWKSMRDLRQITIDVAPEIRKPTEQEYDVIVVGGEPEGVAAAVAAARNGLSTLLIEERAGLGGLFTYGMLNFLDYDVDLHGQVANAGIFQEWHQLVGGKVTFDIPTGQAAFLYLVQQEENVQLALQTKVTGSILSEDGRRLVGVQVQDAQGQQTYYAQRFIDATPDADLAVLAGAPYFIGGADIGLQRKMAVTLMMHVRDVRWDGVLRTVLTKKFGPAKITPTAAWGFVDLHDVYQPVEPNTRLRGLNIARQSDGTVVINALHLFEVDGLDPDSRQEGIERGKRETDHILEFLRKEFPGFEQAQIASYPSELYVRETRHILAEYQLPISDVWEQRDHWDSIGFGSYPVDIQASSVHDLGFVLADPVQYALPFRSLIPLEIEGLLVASRAAGYSSLAAGSARIVPTGMTAGQAAGVAAALSLTHQRSFREMVADPALITQLQEKLKEQGALLYPFELDFPYQNEWYYPALNYLLTYGLISGGHGNDFHLQDTMSELEFAYLLDNALERIAGQSLEYPLYQERVRAIRLEAKKDGTPLTRERVARFLLIFYGETEQLHRSKDLETEKNLWSLAQYLPAVNEQLRSQLTEERALLRLEGYVLVASILEERD